MRFLIAGAGAIGGYIGARLARAGEDVTLFARGPHLRAMQERGVRVISSEGDFEARPRIIGDLAEAGPVDVIFLGVKAHGLTQLAPHITPLLASDTTVVSTQNGVPWWYFQTTAGELSGLADRARRSWRRDCEIHRAASRGWLDRLFFHGNFRARRDSPQRRQPHLAGRA